MGMAAFRHEFVIDALTPPPAQRIGSVSAAHIIATYP
jgi:hypothetical protein